MWAQGGFKQVDCGPPIDIDTHVVTQGPRMYMGTKTPRHLLQENAEDAEERKRLNQRTCTALQLHKTVCFMDILYSLLVQLNILFSFS